MGMSGSGRRCSHYCLFPAAVKVLVVVIFEGHRDGMSVIFKKCVR